MTIVFIHLAAKLSRERGWITMWQAKGAMGAHVYQVNQNNKPRCMGFYESEFLETATFFPKV
jgi:hypothetical protein